MRKLLVILGIPIDDLTMDTALERLEDFIRIGRETGKSHLIATVNADFVVKALSDPELRGILQQADMATADGMPLVWGARLLGVNLSGRVTGADMVPALAERASQKGYSMFLLGAAPKVAERAAEVLVSRYPALRIVGTVSPPYGSILEMDPSVVEAVRNARPDILLVAFGNPKQEKWISMHSHSLQIPVMIGIGGTLDFIAGAIRRAPGWMQRSGLEWLYRLIQEPKRLWRRYVVDLVSFGIFFLRQWWVLRGNRSASTVLPATETLLVDGIGVMTLAGRLERANQMEFMERVEEILKVTPYLVLDMKGAEFLDSSAFGTLVGLTKRAREAGGELWLASVPAEIKKVVSLLRLDRFFELRSGTAAVLDERRSVSTPARPVLTAVEPTVPAAVEFGDKSAVVRMPRRLDASTSPAMQEECAAAITPGTRLILDFSQTVFLSSAGMAAMIKLNKQARAAGGDLRVMACNEDILRTLKLARLDAVIPLEPNEHGIGK